MDRRSHVPRRAVCRCGGEQTFKRLAGKEAPLRLAQISIRGISPDPEIGKLANRAGGLEALQAQRSSDASGDLSAIDHDGNSTGLSSASTRTSSELPRPRRDGCRMVPGGSGSGWAE